MASSLDTQLRIAGSVLFATGFFDAIAGRFLWSPASRRAHGEPGEDKREGRVWRDLAGAIHVHSTYSDGGGDIPDVMTAACAAGVDFVFLTDHNTQRPLRDGWEAKYTTKPLLLIGTEVTVKKGAFLLALDMPPEWEPEKGRAPQKMIDLVNAHGGLPLISLPFDVKHPWREWDVTGCEGLEVLNLSTVARRHINLLSLLWIIPIGWFGGQMAALRALITRPDAALKRWDSLTANGTQSVGIGALDAHALMKIGKKKYAIPSYADTFQAVTTHILIPPDATDARAAIHQAFRQGRCYFSYDCLGDPRPLTFTAENGADNAVMGERIARREGAAILTARTVPGALLRIFYQGRVIAESQTGCLSYSATLPGAYRIECYRVPFRIGPLCLGARPWAFTNPIYVD